MNEQNTIVISKSAQDKTATVAIYTADEDKLVEMLTEAMRDNQRLEDLICKAVDRL